MSLIATLDLSASFALNLLLRRQTRLSESVYTKTGKNAMSGLIANNELASAANSPRQLPVETLEGSLRESARLGTTLTTPSSSTYLHNTTIDDELVEKA